MSSRRASGMRRDTAALLMIVTALWFPTATGAETDDSHAAHPGPADGQ